MSDLLDRLQDMVIFKHDDMSVAQKAIDYIEAQAARIAKLEAALNDITARLLETFPGLKNLPPIQKTTAALKGGKDE